MTEVEIIQTNEERQEQLELLLFGNVLTNEEREIFLKPDKQKVKKALKELKGEWIKTLEKFGIQ